MIRLSAALTRRKPRSAAAPRVDGGIDRAMCFGCGTAIESSQDNMESSSAFGCVTVRANYWHASQSANPGSPGLSMQTLPSGSAIRAIGRHGIELTGPSGRLLGMGSADRAQVISRLQPAPPRQPVSLIQLLAGCAGHVDIERLRLVDPLLPPCRALDQPLGL